MAYHTTYRPVDGMVVRRTGLLTVPVLMTGLPERAWSCSACYRIQGYQCSQERRRTLTAFAAFFLAGCRICSAARFAVEKLSRALKAPHQFMRI